MSSAADLWRALRQDLASRSSSPTGDPTQPTAAAPTTGTSPADDLGQARVTPVPFWLVHGTSDPVVSPSQSRRFAALLAQHGWPVQLEELPTDHAGVVMTEYDPELARCRPGRNSQAIRAGRRVAQILRDAAVSAWPPGQGTDGTAR